MTTIFTTLENTFAATAFTDANDHETARMFCGFAAPMETAMEDHFAAVAFAEANLADEALFIARLAGKEKRAGASVMEDVFAAAAFAEAGQFEDAAAIAGQCLAQEPAPRNLEGFITSVGLSMGRVRYVTVTL